MKKFCENVGNAVCGVVEKAQVSAVVHPGWTNDSDDSCILIGDFEGSPDECERVVGLDRIFSTDCDLVF